MRILAIQSFHDSSVAIINDGKIEAFYKEERYTGIKRDFNPYISILKAFTNVKGKIDHICVDSSKLVDFIIKLDNAPIHFYTHEHHLTHASLAFYNSGFDKSLVFVIDRQGSTIDRSLECETIYAVTMPCNFHTLYKNAWRKYSGLGIAKVYETANTLISQGQFDSGKTMGLSSYGKNGSFDSFFENDLVNEKLFNHKKSEVQSEYAPIYSKYESFVTNHITKDNYSFYADYAYQVQKQTQQQVLKLLKKCIEKTGLNNVCLSGGYFLNVVTNGYLIKNLPDVKFYIEPLADDTGNSIGMGYHLYRKLTRDISQRKIISTSFHGTPEPIVNTNTNHCTTKDIANFLKQQKTVAVFNELSEAGPRALGNRSILFDPTNKNAKDIVNTIKKREWYRPFAGMILEDKFNDYFDTLGLKSSEFMCVSFQCKQPDKIPGVVHIDNSCRVQTINEELPHIFELLTEWNNISNCPVLLNTSFNLSGKPLIETQQEAIKTFNSTDIDILWFPETKTYLSKINI
jgi:carbamoyltransferase